MAWKGVWVCLEEQNRWCGLNQPDVASLGRGKEGVDFGLLQHDLLSLGGGVPGPFAGVKLQDLAAPILFKSRIRLKLGCSSTDKSIVYNKPNRPGLTNK